MLMVKKFGGTSVANKDRIFNVATRCLEDYKKGNEIVLVLSAMGKFTDDLISLANQINQSKSKRDMDLLYTVGEQISVSLMAMAFESLGIPAISLNAFQVGIYTDSNYGDAKITHIDTNRIKNELAGNKIVIVTGFQGVDKENNYTTLGRGGSDTTAVALAAALNADSCEIYTDAIKLHNVSYDEMLEYSNHGAGVLHNKCVKLAKEASVKLIVRSSMSNEEGTVISDFEEKNDDTRITGVTSNENTVSIIGTNINTSILDEVTHVLNENHFNYDSLSFNNMEICANVPSNEINMCVNCMHNLFF